MNNIFKAAWLLVCFVIVFFITMNGAGQYQTGGPAASGTLDYNPVKKALKEGKIVVGGAITAGNVDTAATMAGAGFDFLWIEMEHSPLTLESVRSIILATRGLKAVPFVRVPFNEPWMPKRALDIGALGIIFPFTSTRELAEQAVKSCRYPPLGIRGFGPGMAAARWGMSSPDYVKFANENVLVITIIEQKQAIENIDQIASVPGVDVLFMGVNDLSFSLGVGGKPQDPIVEEAVSKVLVAGKKYGIPVGYPVGINAAELNKRIGQGFRFFQAGGDTGFIQSGAREFLSKIQNKAKPRP